MVKKNGADSKWPVVRSNLDFEVLAIEFQNFKFRMKCLGF